jgi:protoporphyrinogen oxidase
MAQFSVVGSSIAGLITSITLARNGHNVAVHEGSAKIGGRAHTERRNGFHLNLGPHALYNGGCLHQTLMDFGIRVSGRAPSGTSIAWQRGQPPPLPLSPMGLLCTDLMSAIDKLDAARLMAKLPSPLSGETALA